MNRRSFFRFIGSCAVLACVAPGKFLAARPQGEGRKPETAWTDEEMAILASRQGPTLSELYDMGQRS